MLAFRSEAHVDRWCDQRGLPKGEVFSIDKLWRLADRWYSDRMSPGWRRRSTAEAEALFAEVGLRGEFWRLQ